MKPIKFVFILVCLTILLPSQTIAQSPYWNTNGNFVSPGQFLGSTNNQMLDFRTKKILRMQLMQNSTHNVDGYVINNSGFLGLSMDPNWFGHEQPYSLLHLNGEFNTPSGPYSQQFGYRDWMRPGITFTDNGDLMYVGPKRNSQDITDAVISWSDNAAQSSIGPDVLRFLFTDRSGGSTSISGDPLNPYDYDGVEVARMTGDARMGVGPMWNNKYMPQRALDVIRRNDSEPQFRITHTRNINVNLGTNADFQVSAQGNLHILPRYNGAQKTVAIGFLDDPLNLTDPALNTFLDVGGLTRIRKLKDNNPSTLIIGYNFEDVNDGPEDQFLGRLDFPTEDPECMVLNGEGQWTNICDGIAGSDCRWEDINSITITGEQDIRMGFDPTENCYRGKVAIGGPAVKESKLEVTSIALRDKVLTGITSYIQGDQDVIANKITGIKGIANGVQQGNNFQDTYVGVHGLSGGQYSGRYNVGVEATGVGSSSTTLAFGVYAQAFSSNAHEIGVYAEGDIAVYKVGTTVSIGSTIDISDQSLKTDVNDVENATELLIQMQPKSYLMQNPENRDLHFDEGIQYGFIAQEMETVFPEIVKDVVIPEKMDSTGFIEGTSIPLKGIKYQSLIPILVAGFQEQNATMTDQAAQISAQNEQIATMQAQLESQANQLQDMQNDMESMLESVQDMQTKAANCCNCPTKGSTGAIAPNGGKEMQLHQNIPNPFDTQTRIEFSLPESAAVILEITDEVGRPLDRLIDAQMTKGAHSAIWNGSGFAPGVYFYTLYANGQLLTKKMIKN